MLGQVHHFLTVNEADRSYGLDALHEGDAAAVWRAGPPLGRVEFVAGALSIADFAIVGWAWRHERHKIDLDDFPNVKRWYEAMMARPATKRGFEVALS